VGSNTEKVMGYVLLCIGLICILFALHSAYMVFTNVKEPPEIFRMKNFGFLISPGQGNPPMEVEIALEPELRKIVNIFLYYLFMLFILSVGSKIGGLGMHFIREIKIEMRKEG